MNGDEVVMIKTIKVIDGEATIQTGFTLVLDRMTIVNGENNVGKTNFMRIVDNPKRVEFLDEKGNKLEGVQVVYIAADNIRPSDNEAKSSAKTTNLIKNVSKLFSNLNIPVVLSGETEIVTLIQTIQKVTNQNLKELLDDEKYKLELKVGELDVASVIQSLIKEISGLEGDEPRKLDEFGQGMQRLVVVSILKSYLDILLMRGEVAGKHILIVFEEPEIYLHPHWKRMLNKTLQNLASQPNHQLLISTHDPYFVFKNFMEKGVRVVSFKKDGEGKTEPRQEGVDGIEDELLFIMLYGCLKDKIVNGKMTNAEFEAIKILDIEKRLGGYHCDNPAHMPKCDLDYIRHQIHHIGDNPKTVGLVLQAPVDDVNYFLEDELRVAIKEIVGALRR